MPCFVSCWCMSLFDFVDKFILSSSVVSVYQFQSNYCVDTSWRNWQNLSFPPETLNIFWLSLFFRERRIRWSHLPAGSTQSQASSDFRNIDLTPKSAKSDLKLPNRSAHPILQCPSTCHFVNTCSSLHQSMIYHLANISILIHHRLVMCSSKINIWLIHIWHLKHDSIAVLKWLAGPQDLCFKIFYLPLGT